MNTIRAGPHSDEELDYKEFTLVAMNCSSPDIIKNSVNIQSIEMGKNEIKQLKKNTASKDAST
jgi:hypothetical protein